MEPPSIVDRHPTCIAGHWRNGLWMVWTGPVTRDGLRAVDRVGQKLAAKHAQYFSLSISIGGVAMPDAEARDYAAQLVKQREKNVLISVSVLTGDGFWMSASRMVTQAIFALSSQRQKNKVCATFDEAAKLIAPFVQPEATTEDVVSAITAMRSAAK